MKALVIGLACVVALLTLGVFTGVVRIRYARMVDNPVLSHPVAVARVEGHRIFLKDGRVIELDADPSHSPAWRSLREGGGEIEIEAKDDFVTVWGEKRRVVCGGVAAIRIPLIPHDVNGNERALVGFGSWSEEEPEEEAGGRSSF